MTLGAWPYWLMFLIPAWATLYPLRLNPRESWVGWAFVYSLFTLLIGLRHEVGGDWFGYLEYFHDRASASLSEVLLGSDPGYYLFNWLFAQWGGSIHHVNLVCAAILMWGTIAFCRRQPNPWVALAVATPYMLIVVGMDYRQCFYESIY